MKSWDRKVRYRYLHLKRDGMNILVKNHKFITRIGHSIDLSWHPYLLINEALKQEGSYAELWYPGKPASYIKTALKEKDDGLRLDFYCSAELKWDVSLPETQRYFHENTLGFIPFVEWYDEFWKEELSRDVEGYVLKNSNRGDCVKWKPHWDIDLVIKGFVAGNGKYYNTLGALIVGSIDGVIVSRISGMTDKLRREIWDNKDSMLGRVVEVRHNGILSKGGLRHPRFIRFRDDKPAEECRYDASVITS